MQPIVSVIMGSTSDMPVMEAALNFLEQQEIPFEVNALSAHRTPHQVLDFAEKAAGRGIRVIIAAAGGAAHLPGVIAAATTLPVIGVPVKASISMDGWDSMLSMIQMPPGIPVATVGLNASQNAAILAMQIIASGDEAWTKKVAAYKAGLEKKIEKANADLAQVKTWKMKTN